MVSVSGHRTGTATQQSLRLTAGALADREAHVATCPLCRGIRELLAEMDRGPAGGPSLATTPPRRKGPR